MLTRIAAVAALLLTSGTAHGEDRCVKVVQAGASLTATGGEVVGKVWKGALFGVVELGPRVKVSGYNGETRELPKSAVKESACAESLPADETKRRAAFQAMAAAERRATSEAQQRFGFGLEGVDFERLLKDRYNLDALRPFQIDPVSKPKLLREGVEKRW